MVLLVGLKIEPTVAPKPAIGCPFYIVRLVLNSSEINKHQDTENL